MYGLPNLGTHISVNKPVKQYYSGPQNGKSGISEGMGSMIYNRDDYMQTYEGTFMWNNMHGYGEYQWQPLKYKHEGQFYVNKKEGYGRYSYECGAYFEGLYQNDQRFGPGVYTDAAGYQDVGIWVASKLIRLSRILVLDHVMPRLAIAAEDKIRISRYRQIIHLEKDKIKHRAESLLESLTHLRNYDKNVVTQVNKLYNLLCRDNRAPSFNKPRYDKTFFGHESDQLMIDVLMTEEEIQQKIAEKSEASKMENSPSVVIPQIKELKIIYKMYDPADIRKEDQYISEVSQYDVNVQIFKDEKEEEEPDYCGIKQIDLESMNDTLLLSNHKEQWNIFQSSAVNIPQDFAENSNVSSSNEENLQCLSKTEASEEEFDDFGRKTIKDKQPTKKVIVTDLMAWNNSPILIEVLKHVFKHRNFEKKLSFDISKILAGRRGSFRQEGTHEKAALELLTACSNGWQNTIPKLISRQTLDVDVADSRGNTGLLLAAARDRIEVIDTLLNLGANVDCINDECLTPLSLCVLRLLELIHSVTDWSKAFLPKTIIDKSIVDEPIVSENFEQWHGMISYESLVQQLPRQMDWNSLGSEHNSEFNSKDCPIKGESTAGKDAMDAEVGIINPDRIQTQKYIFNMSPIIGTLNSRKKFKSNISKNMNNKMKVKTTTDKKPKDRNISFRSKKSLEDYEQMQDTKNNEVLTKNAKIHATISKLLQRGADPNFAQVPYPVLIMSIFTKMPSVVTELLKHGADPDTTLSKSDNSLTPLLILAVLQPAYEHALIAKALLKAKANPSIRADAEYRPDLMERLKRNRSSQFIDNSEGITALHLLAIRPDMDTDVNEYLEELIGAICQHRCNKRSDLYQGHSPLSLAIFEGNISAVKALLKTTCVNINEQLGADLGNVMLMLGSCALQELLPPDLLQEFLELLLEYGGCPFASANVLGEQYNQIEYGRKELIKTLNPPENKVEVKPQMKKSKSKGSKSSKSSDVQNFVKTIAFIEKIAKEKLIERIKANFVKDLMDSPIMLLSTEKQSELLKDPIFKNALTWMTGEDVAIVMTTMNYNRSNVRELVRLFVTTCILPHQEALSEMHTLVRNETEKIINKVMPLINPKKQMITAVVGKEERKNFEQIVIRQPQSHLEDNRFNVCFECLTVHGKILILCPKCKQVYFCSQECNLKCATQETNLHQCSVFYQKEWIRLEKIATTLSLDPESFMLGRFQNPEIYTDLEKKTARYIEPVGKKGSKNQDDNTYVNIPKCKDQDSIAHKKYGADQLADKNGYQHACKDDSLRGMKGKQQKENGIVKTEDNENTIKPKKQQKEGHAFYRDNKKTGASDMKSNKEKTHLFDTKENLDNNIKSKNTNKRGHRVDTDVDEKDAFNNIKSRERIKKNHQNNKDKDEAADSHKTWKEAKKNRYGHTINGVEGNGENKIKSKKDRWKDQIEEGDSNNIKLKKGMKKGRELSDKEDRSNSKLKNKDNHWRGKKGEKSSTDFYKSKDANFKDHPQRKHATRRNKQQWKNGINKKIREEELNVSNKRYNNRRYVKTNVPEKYLDWLLKVSRSAGDHLNIDMLLLPYVVFAQGDTYFRIIPANQYPKFSGNYSLI